MLGVRLYGATNAAPQLLNAWPTRFFLFLKGTSPPPLCPTRHTLQRDARHCHHCTALHRWRLHARVMLRVAGALVHRSQPGDDAHLDLFEFLQECKDIGSRS